MAPIGVRELTIHAYEILRNVKEKGMRYVVTLHGLPVAAIIPVDQVTESIEHENSAWDELTRLGQQISIEWTSSRNSTETLSDMRH